MRSGSFNTLFARFVPLASILFAALLCLLPELVGQGITTGSITGTVQDQQQQVIPGANVTAVESGTNTPFTAKTLTRGSPSTNSVRPSVCSLTRLRSWSSESPRA